MLKEKPFNLCKLYIFMQMKLIFIRAKTIMLALSGVTLYMHGNVTGEQLSSTNASAVNKYEFMPLFKIERQKKSFECSARDCLLGLIT